jgi:hypothetical protein
MTIINPCPDPGPERVERVAKAMRDQEIAEAEADAANFPSEDAHEKWMKRLRSDMHFARLQRRARAAIEADEAWRDERALKLLAEYRKEFPEDAAAIDRRHERERQINAAPPAPSRDEYEAWLTTKTLKVAQRCPEEWKP